MLSQSFKLEQLFGSKTRARLLGLFLENPDSSFYVRELTRKIDAQLNSVRRELKNLVDLGIVLEKQSNALPGVEKIRLSDKKKFYSANEESLLYRDLRSLFRKISILMRQNLVQEIEGKGSIDYFAFTGRFCELKNVPTDLIIIGEIKQESINKIISQFETEIGEEINYTLMSRDEYAYRRQVTDKFLFSILEGDKVIMVNKLGL